MPKIQIPIPRRAFERVRDRIADILIEEMEYQVTSGYNVDIDAGVYVERFTPFKETELPAINVCLGNGNFANKKPPAADGSYSFFIDAYANSESEEEQGGDSLAAILVQKILGVCHYILSDPIYRTLGYPAPSISSVTCSSIQMIDAKMLQRQDAMNSTMGRLQVDVVVSETNALLEGRLLEGYDTQIKIGTGDTGYAYTGNE